MKFRKKKIWERHQEKVMVIRYTNMDDTRIWSRNMRVEREKIERIEEKHEMDIRCGLADGRQGT